VIIRFSDASIFHSIEKQTVVLPSLPITSITWYSLFNSKIKNLRFKILNFKPFNFELKKPIYFFGSVLHVNNPKASVK
jgi:hypothetical protein